MTPTIPSNVEQASHLGANRDREGEFVLWRDFKPEGRGILGLVDDMLEHIVRNRLRLHWVRGGVTEIPLEAGEPRIYEFGFRNSAARAVIARLAVLCDDETKRDPIYPYRGVGDFTDPRWPNVRFHVEFNNTPAEQRLELTPVFASEPS